ncbi:MAG TPA: hypothetical protein VFV38_09220 [Ktedonobacteraceae bacterium]|nr:hypothetical protein [Ktedonobacteraceae bacterium]
MSLLLTAQQCFFIVILVFAVVGFQRGWKRELVSLGFSLGAVLFLYLGGGNGLAHFLFVTVPILTQIVISPSGTAAHPASNAVPPTDILLTTVITFIVIVGAGYLIGNKAFPKPNTPQERLMGILPAVVSGYFLMLYVTNVLAKSPLITFAINTPNQGQVGNSVFVLFLIALVVILAALIAASAKKSSGGKK